MFLCHARSGHSLFGSLLDAHPDMVVALELNAVKLIQRNITRDELFTGLLRRSRNFTRAGRRWNGYDYRVPNQWQGRCRNLKVIGDKKGSVSAQLLQRDPQLLAKLRLTVEVPVKIFRVVRNPYDNIRTLARYYHGGRLTPAVRGYFSLCATIEQIRREFSQEDWMDIYHEKLIASPEQILTEACRFLGVKATPDYLLDCSGTVFKSPHKRRLEVKWTQEQREQIEVGIRQYSWLDGYTFDS